MASRRRAARPARACARAPTRSERAAAPRPQLLAGDGVAPAVRDGNVMPHAASAAWIWGLSNMPSAALLGIPLGIPLGMPLGAPLGLPLGAALGLPLGIPLGIPLGLPVGTVIAIPAAFRHSWIFACSAGSAPAPGPPNPPDCEAAGVDPDDGELAEPLHPATRPATARAATPSRVAAANDTVVLFT